MSSSLCRILPKNRPDIDYRALGLGLGLALLPMRIGMVGSLIGWGCLIIVVLWILLTKKVSLGEKMLGLPLLGLVILQNLQGVEFAARVLPVLMFGVYLAATRLDSRVFVPVGVIATAGGLVLIALNLITGDRTGGFYSVANYNIAIGAIVLGAVLWQSKWQWLALTVALVATILSGAEEGLVVLGLLALAIIVRKDFAHRRQVIAISAVVTVALAAVIANPAIWNGLIYKVKAAQTGDFDEALGERLDGWSLAVEDITPLGHGYNPHGYDGSSIHSMSLMALHQTGIIGLGLYLWVMGYGIFKTRMKYAFIALFGLGLFDSFLWTQIPAYTFAIAGVAAVSEDSDLIFRRST